MAISFRSILITLSVLAVVGIIGIAFLGWGIYTAFDRFGTPNPPPEELKQARVLTGGDLLEKKEVYRLPTRNMLNIVVGQLGETDEEKKIQWVNSEMAKLHSGYSDCYYDAEENEIVFAGQYGATTVERDGGEKRQILFQPATNTVKWGVIEQKAPTPFDEYMMTDLDKNGDIEFIGYSGLGGLAVFDHAGNGVWRQGGQTIDIGKIYENAKKEKPGFNALSVTKAATGDLDGDGRDEIVVLTDTGMLAFNHKGEQLWKHEYEDAGSELLVEDLDNDGRSEIIELSYGPVRIRGNDGKEKTQGQKYEHGVPSGFVVDNGEKKELNFIDFSGNKISVTDGNNKTLWEADAPLSEVKAKSYLPSEQGEEYLSKIYDAKVAQVRLDETGKMYTAVLGNYGMKGRAVLYIYSPDKKLVYNEVLPEESTTIMTIPGEKNGIDELWIGGKHAIWRFTVK